MSHFILHTKAREKKRLAFLAAGAVCLLSVCVGSYVIHSIGTARAKSQETVLIYTEEEFEQYLLDTESEEYNLSGRYQLEADLDLSRMEKSIGTNLEPFAGVMDGNGHVISGLSRPLFGVMAKAEVDGLFLSDVEIVHPFTYSDGETYVDGYSALAVYVLDSKIHNCGMSGEIQTASPSEAEYLLGKASPSEADEWKGPGAETSESSIGTSVFEEEGKQKEEAVGPGEETIREDEGFDENKNNENADHGDTDHGDTEDSKATEAGSENIEETETTASGNGASEADSSKAEESAKGEETGKVEESAKGEETGKVEESAKGEETGKAEESAKDGETGKAEEPAKDGETGKAEESAKGEETGKADESGNGAGIEIEGAAETVGYQASRRQSLMMKVSPVMDADANALLIASPGEATPAEAEETAEPGQVDEAVSSEGQETLETEPEPEYIGNPDGDICILVLAERVNAGGLVAETAGNTKITDSFSLVTIGSGLKEIDTYTGGFVSIIGKGSQIENSYASGLADSDDITGGFAAVNMGRVQNCYSTMIVGESGRIRGAFAAQVEGMLRGCVYDRQMACVIEEENAWERAAVEPEDSSHATPSEAEEVQQADFGLKGLNTTDMTGVDAGIPGIWYTTKQAYPQIPYFAEQKHEKIATDSKMSVIALILPDDVTLEDAIKGDEILLPYQIDGQEVHWESDGEIKIDDGSRAEQIDLEQLDLEQSDLEQPDL